MLKHEIETYVSMGIEILVLRTKENNIDDYRVLEDVGVISGGFGGSIMLLDEPTAVLTPQETDQLKNSLKRLSEEDEKTIVLISHKLKEIREFTETVFVMKNGGQI